MAARRETVQLRSQLAKLREELTELKAPKPSVSPRPRFKTDLVPQKSVPHAKPEPQGASAKAPPGLLSAVSEKANTGSSAFAIVEDDSSVSKTRSATPMQCRSIIASFRTFQQRVREQDHRPHGAAAAAAAAEAVTSAAEGAMLPGAASPASLDGYWTS